MNRLLSARGLLTCYGLLSAVAYATLLPLWEGYDEPYHYAYVQHLDRTGSLPVLDKTSIGGEVWRSMTLVPTNSVNARLNPAYTSYTQFFHLSDAERASRRNAVFALRPGFDVGAGGDNYEAQQAPLAYLALLPLHRVTNQWPLHRRVWLLRVFGACVSVLLFIWVMYALAMGMGISEPYQHAAVFCLLSTQSLYGAVAHVANDWLSLPLIPVLLLSLNRFWHNPTPLSAIAVGGVLVGGLLAKSYFLVFILFVMAIVLWRRWQHLWITVAVLLTLAAPWYARNLILYDSLTGLQASVRAVPKAAIWATALSTSWPGALAGMARGGLWSANGSFTTFSSATLNFVLLLLAAGCLLGLRLRKQSPQYWILLCGTVLFSAIPIYAMLLFGTMYGQVHPGANSWYTAGMLPGVLLIAFAGSSSVAFGGRWICRLTIILSTYVVAATYFAKLIPLYTGFDSPARPEFIRTLYCDRYDEVLNRLGQTAMWSGEVVILMAASVVVFSAVLCWRLSREVYPERSHT